MREVASLRSAPGEGQETFWQFLFGGGFPVGPLAPQESALQLLYAPDPLLWPLSLVPFGFPLTDWEAPKETGGREGKTLAESH